MQQNCYPRQVPSVNLPYLARPISARYFSEDEGEPDAYQLYPFSKDEDPGSPICESTFPTISASVSKATVPEKPRQLANVSEEPAKVWSWKKKGSPWSKVKLLQYVQAKKEPLPLTPPPFPLPETIDVLVAGISRLGILKPSRKITFDGASCSMPMTRID